MLRAVFLVAALLGPCSAALAAAAPQVPYEVTRVGSSQTYRSTSPKVPPGTRKSTVVEAAGDRFVRKETTGAKSYVLTTFAAVDGGVYLSEQAGYGADGSVVGRRVYTPPALILPANLGAGTTARSTSSVKLSSGDTFQETREVKVDGEESVDVPAGTYRAVKVTTSIRFKNSDEVVSTVTTWWVKGKGCVKTVAFATNRPEAVSTLELTASSR